jgi:hypothetical protein
MQPHKVYDEVIEFIASSSPQNVIGFRPSDEAKARVVDLISRTKQKVYLGMKNPNSITTFNRTLKAPRESMRSSQSGKWLDGLVPNCLRRSLTAQTTCANTV